MKLKLLLFLFLIGSGMIKAQEPYRSLIISEFNAGGEIDTYVELTNMGEDPINLENFKLGKMAPWSEPISDIFNDPWLSTMYFFLPDYELQPGESYVIKNVRDFGPEQYRKKVPGFEGQEREFQPEWWELADLIIHLKEQKGDETDSITHTLGTRQGSTEPWDVMINWRGRSAYYIEQHLSETDSVVIDQVSGVFDNNGRNQDVSYDVAGVDGAVSNSTLVRKFSVKTGNLDFANARGVGLDDSEWMPIPKAENKYRDLPWTIGNHGAYNLNENTLESDIIDVDFANKTLTVPWGIIRGDGIMRNMKKKPGVFWDYKLNSNPEDSASFAVHTGDKLIIYVCGNDLDVDSFNIVAAAPTASATTLVPVVNIDPDGNWRNNIGNPGISWPRITNNDSGMDTITGNWYGLPYATRVDSLLERLEKPTNSTWNIIWADGAEKRADLIKGDVIRVTAEDGTTHDYYIELQNYQPNHNADLAAITWPDIPPFTGEIFGWKGDTIPGFGPATFNYRITVPYEVDGIPALVAKPASLNSKVEVKRATSLSGTVENRTVEFHVTAEDDSITNTYKVELVKEQSPQNIQKFEADPFFSEVVNADQWAQWFFEVFNPGNQILDLSNYMICNQYTTDPNNAITWNSGENEWLNRYTRYIPGYKWVDETQWQIAPGTVVQDLNVSPILQPGETFNLGSVVTDRMLEGQDWWYDNWTPPKQLDVQFNNVTVPETGHVFTNPWNEQIDQAIGKIWYGSAFIFKILNDSIKLGLKPANDPNDFELVETWGPIGGSDWIIGGADVDMISNYMRKPEVWHGNTLVGASNGTSWEESEWTKTNWDYWIALNTGWPAQLLNVSADLGQHFFNVPTHYMSTVSSLSYKVSPGYSMNEEIRGVRTGQTVSDLFSNLIKANENQTLTVIGTESGNEMAMDALLNMNDTLIVMSADSTNTTKYLLEVTEEGLSSDAVLTSSKYQIDIIQQPSAVTGENNTAEMGKGTISGFEYGTQINTLLSNIAVPNGASLSVINGEGAYVPLTMLNFDTSYVSVTVNHNTYFEVVAEDGVTSILYQLQPQASESSAFLTSDVYSVDQRDLLIEFVPRGTSVDAFLSNVLPSVGASIKIIDKFGLERTDGQIYQDDKIVVTSPNGEVQNAYYLSMLRTQYLRSTTYLAYVTSNVYSVDQLDMTISGGLSGDTEVNTFYSRITPAMGATAVVVDANGTEKNSGTLDAGDMVKVTSADGMVEVMYEISFAVSAKLNHALNIQLYPNPTSGKVNISGVKAGERIRVFNSMGANVSDIKVQSNLEVISLDNQPAGMYMIVISEQDQTLGKYKVLKR